MLFALLLSCSLTAFPTSDSSACCDDARSAPSVGVSVDTTKSSPAASETTASHDSVAPRAATHISGRPGPFDWLTNLPDDWGMWGRQTFTAGNIPWIAGMGLLTTGLVVTDYETWQPFKKAYDRSTNFRQISDHFVFAGDGKFQFGLAGLFGLYGFIANDDRAVRTASQTVEVILACGAVVQLMKHLTGRESPFVATTRTGRWALLPNQLDYAKHVPHYDAFPSGHVATALATLTVIAENYSDAPWIRYIGYPAVGMIAVGLVATSIHWWSDIPLGALLGYHFGMIVSHRNPDHAVTANGLTSPDVNLAMLPTGSPAIDFSWRW